MMNCCGSLSFYSIKIKPCFGTILPHSYYLIGRIIMGRVGEYDFHITTLMIFHICCICQKKFSTYGNGWTIEGNNF